MLFVRRPPYITGWPYSSEFSAALDNFHNRHDPDEIAP
jgi:hypothetical protein